MTQDEMVELAKQANFEWLTPDVRTLILLAVAKEREACAKVCMGTEQKFAELSNKFSFLLDAGGVIGASQCLNAIRARGQA